MANMLWSLAILEHRPPRAFLDALAASALQCMRDFSPQHLANSAWACARLGCSPLQGRLMHAILSEVRRGASPPMTRTQSAEADAYRCCRRPGSCRR